MRIQPALALCLVLGLSEARRYKFGHHYDDDDDNGSSSNDDGGSATDNMYNPGDTDDADRNRTDSVAPCGWVARQETFGLPGLYYNGTLRVTHEVSDNTACSGDGNNGPSPRTYEYPGLLLIAPTGNESDTNPLHWSLRGFQPVAGYNNDSDSDGALDMYQRWVYLRSSDFVVWPSNYSWVIPFSPWRMDRYADADATAFRNETRVYWDTTISQDGDGSVYSARATYKTAPPVIQAKDYADDDDWSPGLYSSQYVTLSDVCASGQEQVDGHGTNELDAVDVLRQQLAEDDGARKVRRATLSNETVESPTVWLSEGATAQMEGIGSRNASFTLNQTLRETVPWMNHREPGCPQDTIPFEQAEFFPMQSDEYEDGTRVSPWNITVNIRLSFEGTLVGENSTTITGEEDGKLLFDAEYRTSNDDGENAAVGLSVWSGSLMLGALATLLVV